MSESAFSSKLEHATQRFLAHALENAFEVGRRTPVDFIRHFPPIAIMEALADRQDLRADLLVPTTGLKRRIAVKKSWKSAGEDIQTALDEGETDAQTLVSAFEPDERVRYLDARKLWAFLVEGQFWTLAAKAPQGAIARKHTAYLIDRALTDKLLTPRDVVEGISVAYLTSHMPRAELAKVITTALESGRTKAPFTEADLLAALPPSVIVEHVPLAHVFETVVHAKIALAHDYVAKPKPPEPARVEPAQPAVASPTSADPPAATAEAAATPPAEEVEKPKSRKTKPPPARASKPAPAETDEENEWVEIPDSVR